MPPLVSIVVTSYNHAEYLDIRMDSLLKQTYKNIEIVVIDDYSSDNSVEVLEKYRSIHHVTIISLKKNRGYATACNYGVSLCKGEYIMFAECDDYNDPHHVATLLDKLLLNESTGVAYSRSTMVDSQGKNFGYDFEYREKKFKIKCNNDTLISSHDMQRFLLNSCAIPNMSAALFKKKYFQEISGLSESYKVCADWDFWCRISLICDFYYVATPLNFFRNHPTTVRSTSGILKSIGEIIRILSTFSTKVDLHFIEKMKFRINLGYIWLLSMKNSPRQWLSSFYSVSKVFSSLYRLWFFYLSAGAIKIVLRMIRII